MEILSPLEQAVLDAIALQVPEIADALAVQQGQVRVTARENTGAGFYTTLDVSRGSPIKTCFIAHHRLRVLCVTETAGGSLQ
jgi:hypothetical protein